jgi:hypothetical protein
MSFAAQCCQWNFAGAERVPVHPSPQLDWPRFVRLVRFHRVQGLVWNSLASAAADIPASAARALSSDASAIAASNLHSALECRRLAEAFDSAGLALLFVKGLTLGALAYRSAMAKAAIDIDIVIAPDELNAAACQLVKLGYELIVPAGPLEQLSKWHRRRKESVWQHKGYGLQLDVHTRLADHRRLLPTVGARSPRQLVKIAEGVELATLADDELFAYLTVHGASSAWFRLKWISDFAALVSDLRPAAIAKRYRQSQDLGAGRAAGQALLLADSLFGSLEQLPTLRDELQRDAAIRRLHTAALKQLAGSPEPVEPTSTPLGTLRIHWTQFLLQRGARFKWSELVRQVRVMLP